MKKRGLVAAIIFAACTQLALAAGAGEVAAAWIDDAITSGSLISASLRHEHGEPIIIKVPPSAAPLYTAAPVLSEYPLVSTPKPTETAEIRDTTIYGELDIDNATSIEIDPDAIMESGLNLKLPSDAPQILIIHTHATESYTAVAGDDYEESDYARTTNNDYNVVKIGDVLAEALEAQGLNVIHDRELYDYPSYTGSYTRCGDAIERHLAENPELAIVIDLHRDAIGSADAVYKTVAEIPNTPSSQIMLLVGTGENGLAHPKWQENLKLALTLQDAASTKYPTLMRPLAIRKERYNQQLTTGSLIIEVGSNGNTLAESITAIVLFADAISPALLELVAENN